MKKQLLFLGLSILFLVSCGNEVTEVKKKAEYIYVEIEECSIPVPKMYKKIKSKNTPQYYHRYVYDNGLFNSGTIFTQKRLEDSYEKIKTSIERMKKVIDRERKDNQFTIIETYTQYKKRRYTYFIFGIKTYIVLDGSNEEVLNYTLEYCKKTWKLDKGEDNASTAK